MAEQSLKDKTVNGTFWSAADAFFGQGVTFIVGVILARLLSPDEYGLIGICLIFNTVLNGIVDSGFSNALIRKNDVSNGDYNTMFLTNMFISTVLYVVLFFSTPFISIFFKRPELTSLIRITSLVLFFNALSLTHATILTKRIDFKTKTKASVSSAVISGIIGIVMAYTGFGVWALVSQLLSRQLIYTLALWILIKWWPTLAFSKVSFRYMWGFGWKLLLSGLLNNIWNQLYQVVIGRFYSPATLGQYTRGRQISAIFSENLTAIVQRVSFPILSQIQNDKERLVSGYRRIIKMTMFITVITMFSMAGMSKSLIYCLIGPQWHQAATFLPLICISMSLYPLHAINLNMLQVQGRSDIFLYIEIAKKTLSIIPVCIGIFVDIYWMLIATIIVGIMSFFLNSWYSGKNLGYSSFKQLYDIAPSLVIGLIIAVCVYAIGFIFENQYYILVLQIVSAISLIVIICKLTKNAEYNEIKKIVTTKIHKR